MRTKEQIADRIRIVRTRNTKRDQDYKKVMAIRRGDYEAVAPGLFNTAEFDKPLVANLVDTMARDIAEVMAPLPTVNCPAQLPASEARKKRAELRSSIANGYIQNSRLQDQMFAGADRYGSFGFMALIVEPDFDQKMPVIRIGDVATAHYTRDYRGRTVEYFEVYQAPVEQIKADFPDAAPALKARYERYQTNQDQMCEVVRFYDSDYTFLMLLDPCMILTKVKNHAGCPVRVVERPMLQPGAASGQFDDVIWVQIARALIQMYTMSAIEQSVNAPIAMPKDVDELDIGPHTVVQSEHPEQIGRVPLQLPAGLFPESQILAQEQRLGSRYPEGRSGTIDASIITGQGVQALMGTFDTQVQTFQRLFASALEDVIELCFRTDEHFWPNTKKSRHIRDNGALLEYEYTPSKDIDGNYLVDVTYGAIAGLDPNRGLVFVLQALAGGLIAKSTARKTLPVDLNIADEERQIQLETIDESVSASLAMIPQAIPQMAMMGQDPREVALQTVKVRELVQKGKSVVEAMQEVFAPKEKEGEAPAPNPMQQVLDQAMGGGAPGGAPAGLASPGTDLLMSLTGLTPSGKPNLQSTVSRREPV